MRRWWLTPFHILCLVMLLACGSPSGRLTRTDAAPTCDLTPFPLSQQGALTPRLRNAIGGGQVQEGPFLFCLVLYADPALLPPDQAKHPSMASEIPGIGAMALWVYHGPTIRGRVTESFGPLPDGLQPSSGSYQLRHGQTGGRFGGGIPLPKGSRLGDRIELGTIMETPAGTYGAKIAFKIASQGVKEVSVFGW